MSSFLAVVIYYFNESVFFWGYRGAIFPLGDYQDACWDIDGSCPSDRLIIVMVVTQMLRK